MKILKLFVFGWIFFAIISCNEEGILPKNEVIANVSNRNFDCVVSDDNECDDFLGDFENFIEEININECLSPSITVPCIDCDGPEITQLFNYQYSTPSNDGEIVDPLGSVFNPFLLDINQTIENINNSSSFDVCGLVVEVLNFPCVCGNADGCNFTAEIEVTFRTTECNEPIECIPTSEEPCFNFIPSLGNVLENINICLNDDLTICETSCDGVAETIQYSFPIFINSLGEIDDPIVNLYEPLLSNINSYEGNFCAISAQIIDFPCEIGPITDYVIIEISYTSCIPDCSISSNQKCDEFFENFELLLVDFPNCFDEGITNCEQCNGPIITENYTFQYEINDEEFVTNPVINILSPLREQIFSYQFPYCDFEVEIIENGSCETNGIKSITLAVHYKLCSDCEPREAQICNCSNTRALLAPGFCVEDISNGSQFAHDNRWTITVNGNIYNFFNVKSIDQVDIPFTVGDPSAIQVCLEINIGNIECENEVCLPFSEIENCL